MDESISCGIDLEEIGRFKKFVIFPDKVEPFIHSIFTQKEIDHSLAFGNLLPFALGFSCKESVFKALGLSWTNSSIKWHDIELLFPDKGNINTYEIKLSGFAKELYDEKGYQSYQADFEYNSEFVVFKILMLKTKS